MTINRETLIHLPKAELHCHLDGSLRISTILELAKNQGVNLPANNEQDLANLLFVQNKVKILRNIFSALK